ncbi:PI-PLC X domain-containing protein 1 isoform X2 [Polyodon spathula]|uniref:PI-PLC X domain-containing protein 1 isoform X2 n=1 Tax=Polyodon spathula TaxID=7913 RepID=UPI001B7E70ED|nr:PI-PLC X domain-containing protein 1 isoform X2 [Polyodon spathula]
MTAADVRPILGDQNNKNWMAQLPEQLWDMPLYNLAIPGSHDTMSFCLDINSPIVESVPGILKIVDRIIPCVTRPMILKWSRTQKALEDFAQWLETYPKEAVILACSHFEGLTEDLHNHLIWSLKIIFGSKLCPNTEIVTLRNLWKLGYQVIVSYDDPAAEKHQDLWSGIPYWWANRVDPEVLVEYLEYKKQGGRPGGFFVAGLNLTAETAYIISHLSESLKKLALQSYPYLMNWVQKQSPGPSKQCLNIIAGDFIRSENFVSEVIALNKKLRRTNTGIH